jgi:hypothetical protein
MIWVGKHLRLGIIVKAMIGVQPTHQSIDMAIRPHKLVITLVGGTVLTLSMRGTAGLGQHDHLQILDSHQAESGHNATTTVSSRPRTQNQQHGTTL